MNDESVECRRMVVLALQKLIVSISESKRNDLYLAAKDWLESKKASLLMTIFLTKKIRFIDGIMRNSDQKCVIFRKCTFVLPSKH